MRETVDPAFRLRNSNQIKQLLHPVPRLLPAQIPVFEQHFRNLVADAVDRVE